MAATNHTVCKDPLRLPASLSAAVVAGPEPSDVGLVLPGPVVDATPAPPTKLVSATSGNELAGAKVGVVSSGRVMVESSGKSDVTSSKTDDIADVIEPRLNATSVVLRRVSSQS